MTRRSDVSFDCDESSASASPPKITKASYTREEEEEEEFISRLERPSTTRCSPPYLVDVPSRLSRTDLTSCLCLSLCLA